MWRKLVFTLHTVGIYDILIIQDRDGELISIKIHEYEPESTETSKYFHNDENLYE